MTSLLILLGFFSPATALGDLIGLYTFEDGTASNQIVGAGALPNLTESGVILSGGAAVFTSQFSYLELPVVLGNEPFTILLDATYDPQPTSPNFAVSQFGATNNSFDVDFIIQQFPGTSNRAEFFNGEGGGVPIDNGSIDGDRHRIAITWDGSTIGNFFDGTLMTANIGGTLPDIDASVVRFGDRSLNDGIGATGTVHEIRIFDMALSEDQLNDSDGDGIPDSEDVCPDSDPSDTVIIDGCDSGVGNQLFDDGCTISDLVVACADDVSNHGEFVSCVAALSNDLKETGSIAGGRQKGAIRNCAAQAG
jgi:hypothetical protein